MKNRKAETISYKVDEAKVQELVETFDPELRFRKLKGAAAGVVLAMCIILALFHIYTAGFGVLQEWKHRTFHLAFVLSLIFLVYPTRKVKIKRLWLTWTYEVIFALMSGTILSLGLQDVLDLKTPATVLVFVLGFFMAFAMKTRDLWKPTISTFLDLSVSVTGLGVLTYLLMVIVRHWEAYVASSDIVFIIWTFVIISGLAAPFLFMFRDAARIIQGKKEFHYDPQKIPYFEITLAVMAVGFSSYIIVDFDQFVYRAGFPNVRDLVIGNFAILLALEGTRRSIGLPLAILGLLVLANCYLGPYLSYIPGLDFFAHRGFSAARIIDHMYLGTECIYGIPLGVVATFVFHFVLFGIFTMKTGLGKLFIDLAMALAGWSAGGPAKVSVLASGLMGTISGSSVANTVTTGAFTIPMMKKLGYKSEFAGAVEATASTGGQFMPPIMGAAAFIMAEFLGISYLTIATCAIVPAVCHFFAVGWMVHLEAKKNNMRGIPRDQLPSVKYLIQTNGTLFLPLIVIIWLLVTGFTPFLAAFWGIIASVSYGQSGPRTKNFFIAVSSSIPVIIFRWNPLEGPMTWTFLWAALTVVGLYWSWRKSEPRFWIWGTAAIAIMVYLLHVGKEEILAAFCLNFFVIIVGLIIGDGRMRFGHVIECLEWGTKNALAIGAACTAVGFIVGTTTLTGLGLKFANATIVLSNLSASLVDKLDVLNLFALDQTTLFFTMVYTVIACLILGMGLSTTQNYIVVSIIAAPALMKFGIAPLLSHLFVFYYGIMADVTPPVAVAAYAASGISQGDPFKTGLRAYTLSLAEVYVPFAFVFTPALVFMPWILENPRPPFPWLEFIGVLVTVILGIMALGAIVIGYFGDRVTVYERLILVPVLVLLWWHELYSSIVGAGMLLGLYLFQRYRRRLRESREGVLSEAVSYD
ncbi:MAG: TRAP transporter fused permease subunit [Deltaproteobacteria bacterium]|nr:TRAP transporter fused permease subunit [Deltaproteobacteria bacterium]